MTIDKITRIRPSSAPELDPSTLSNYHKFSITEANLNLDVLFEEKIVKGTVCYKIKATKPNETKVILDTSYLDIGKIRINGLPTKNFQIGQRKGALGSPLMIYLPTTLNDYFDLQIQFSTTTESTALQFIDKEATDDKNAPYLFSQCQAIHARSLFPTFDTPSVKMPYKFRISSPYPCLMSGRHVNSKDNTYEFEQPIPIPSYLVALASGDIKSAPIGPRSTIYTEGSQLKASQWEFEKDMERFIKTAESLIFNYEWSTYDALVLPSSFPYGGMENPNITFVTPTLISGDRSQVRVIAHELAHSWLGNLVTNSSWEHFWLNEGWTVYLERRIIAALAEHDQQISNSGICLDPNYPEKVRGFAGLTGLIDLQQSMETIKPVHTRLVVDLKQGEDPDDSFSKVPYEKGFNFLFYLEHKLGQKKEFDPFIKYYFQKFKYKSLDSYQFIDTLYEFFVPRGKREILDSVDWYGWLFNEGMPPKMDFDGTFVEGCYDLASKWVKHLKGDESCSEFSESVDIGNFNSSQHVLFLQCIASSLEPFHACPNLIREFVSTYPFYATNKNCEIKFQWNNLVLRFGALDEGDAIVKSFANWLGAVGRMKFVRPGYRLLLKFIGHDFAIKTFQNYKSRYHPICRSIVEKDLRIN